MRINISELEPKLYRWVQKLDGEVSSGDILPAYYELIKIRASQINNCGYCIHTHINAAIKQGESQTRIDLLSQWKNLPQLFDEKEQVILGMTEEITNISNGLSDELYNKAIKLFGSNYTAQLIMAIITINVWNRIGVSTEMEESLRL